MVVGPTFAFAQQVCVPNPRTDEHEWHGLGDLLNVSGPFVTHIVGYPYRAHGLDGGQPER